MDDPAQAQATNPSPQVPVAPVATVDPGQDLDQLTKDHLPTFADEVKQFEDQQLAPLASKPKEQEPAVVPAESVVAVEPVESTIAVEEIPNTPEIEPHKEIAGYMEKIEKEAELTSAVTDDYTQQVLLTSTAPQNPTITLPLSEEQVKLGLHHKVWEAITWLAWWCVRQAQLLPGRVKYKQ